MIYINGRFLTQRLTGVQRFAYEMFRALLISSPTQFCVLVPPAKIDAAYDVSNWPIKVIGKLKNSLWEQLDLPFFLVRNNKPLLISLVNTAPCFYSNQIVSILDMTTFVNPRWFNYLFAAYYKVIVPRIAKNSLKVITISEHSKQDILKYVDIPGEKIDVIHCAVSDKFLERSALDQGAGQFLDRLGVEKEGYILGVSSLDPRKNFRALIEAYLLLDSDLPLVIVGSKGKAFADNNLDGLLSSERIIFTGYVEDDDLILLYQAAKCFVYPSLYEGFGMPPLEAMACGSATIVSNTSSMPEVCGSASLYVDPLDVVSIKDAMSKLLSDNELRKKLIDLGKDRCRIYSWNASSEKLKVIIERNLR
ncbi:glycosyltransferase family 4 protein [Arcticibacter sp.]|uniref:glycosyltransferase family 4 protein n=1 Tax=Arcticibacter sp. TaxID=1872630 RepID=UPI00388D8AF7